MNGNKNRNPNTIVSLVWTMLLIFFASSVVKFFSGPEFLPIFAGLLAIALIALNVTQYYEGKYPGALYTVLCIVAGFFWVNTMFPTTVGLDLLPATSMRIGFAIWLLTILMHKMKANDAH